MRHILRKLIFSALVLALMASPFGALGEAAGSPRDARSFFQAMFGGRTLEKSEPTPTPEPTLDAEFLFGDLSKKDTPAPDQLEPTPEPTLDAEILFGNLFKKEMPEPEPSAIPETTLSPEPEPTPWPKISSRSDASFFDEGVREITCQPWGGKVDYAYVGGWTVSRGYFDGRYCLTGIAPLDADRVVLSENDPMNFVPAGDAFVYYGDGTEGDYGWLMLAPGEKRPLKLPLDAADEVFYADDRYIWYYSPGKGESRAIGRMALDGSKKKKLGTVKGRVVTMVPGMWTEYTKLCVDPLVSFEGEGKLVYEACESYETSADGLTWTFNLRRTPSGATARR